LPIEVEVKIEITVEGGRKAPIAPLPALLADLLEDLNKPPIEKIGAPTVDASLPKTKKKSLAAALNTLLASPTLPAGVKAPRST